GMKKIHVCFDRDEAGEKGADHLIRLLEENLSEAAIYKITLPDRLPAGGDITDYFEKYDGNPDELMLDLPKLVKKKASVDSSKLQPIRIDELMQMQFSENEWVIEKIAPSQGITIISGAPASYKTWLLLEMAKCIAGGTEFLQKFKCKQSNVLIVDEENHPNLIKKRLESLGIQSDLPIHLLSQKNFIVTDENLVKQILEICRERDIGTVFMDSLVRINNAEENDASQMSKVFQSIKKLCQAGMTVILTHHERKETFVKSSAQNRLRGSSDISASADTHLSIRKDKDNPKKLIVEQAKNRYEMEMEPWEVDIKQEGNKISFAFAGAHNKEGRKKDEAKAIIANVLAENEEGLLRRELAAKLKELANIGGKSVREAVDEMIKGEIIVEKAGKGNEKRICLKDEQDPARNGELAL
ncbi:MAG TPA: AAA family ATPase, partial [Candidatus Bathyarchaeia archaeon]|nr:AAA family ATPase [Candidatus Bathyarchaeia archaeon]HLP47546.1 AAA family ATPase [Candidatus Kapabacteria bacterium]